MKPKLSLLLNISIPFLIIIGLCLVLVGTFGQAEAKYKPSPATAEMSKDIKAAQAFVKEYEQQILEAKEKATVYRQTICQTEKEACTKEFLDPLGSGVDLSSFLALAAK